MQIGQIMAFLLKKGRKWVMSQINKDIFLTPILAEFLENAKISHCRVIFRRSRLFD
jgi:hypothetical protein